MSMSLQARTMMTTRVLLGAVGACLGLAALLWLFAGPSAPDSDVEPLEVRVPDAGGIAQGPGEEYPMMLEQPLFWAERAPSLAADGDNATAGTAAGPDGLVFLGVLVNEPLRQVLLRDGESVHVLREGETIRGLEVRHINAEGVLLGNATSEVKLPVPVDRTEFIEIRRME